MQTVQKLGDSTAQFLGMVLTHQLFFNDRCLARVAQCLVRLWLHVLHQLQGGFWKNSQLFQREGNARLLRSIHVLLSTFEVAALIVDNGSGMFCIGFAGLDAPLVFFFSL